jgi:tetratricopeptide (TPR) repeat protein/peroxiredoxin
VSPSPETTARSGSYENGWIAINRLIREGGTWSGHERKVVYWNCGNGKFSDVSGVSGLDFPEDGRAFAAFDFDLDGDEDLVLKNRNSPQLRLLRNDSPGSNHSIAFHLQGSKSNRDAVGARLVLETSTRTYSKTVRSGSGFLSQPSRILYFGLGSEPVIRQLTVFWPGGAKQTFQALPADHLIQLEEGRNEFKSIGFRPAQEPTPVPVKPAANEIQARSGFWLTETVPSPQFELRGFDGTTHRLENYRGRRLLLNFWATWCRPCQAELADLQARHSTLESQGVSPLLISVDEPGEQESVRSYVASKGLTLPVLFATEEVISQYSLLLRQILDYASDLVIPTSFLLDESGEIVKVYLGSSSVDGIVEDLKSWPNARSDLLQHALPFSGRSFATDFRRNWTVLADSFALVGFNTQALTYLQHAIQTNPQNALALDHMGLIYANQGKWKESYEAHQKAVELSALPIATMDAHLATALLHLGKPVEAGVAAERALSAAPQDPETLRVWASVQAGRGKLSEALNALQKSSELDPESASGLYNLGFVHEKMGHRTEAVAAFHRAISVDPRQAEALNALGTLSAEGGELEKAGDFFRRAVAAHPDFAEAYRNLGLVHVQQSKWKEAEASLRTAVNLQPSYADALNDLGGVYLKTERYQEALPLFQQAQRENPLLVQAYLNAVRVYVALGQREKAVATLEALLRVRPREPAAVEWLQQLKNGSQ